MGIKRITFDQRFIMCGREGLKRALLDLGQSFDTAARNLYDVALETESLHQVPCPDLPTALNDEKARPVLLKVAEDDYELHVRGVGDARPPVIVVKGYGPVPREVLDAVHAAIDPFRRHDGSGGWLGRAWSWFRRRILAATIAEVLGGAVLLVLTPSVLVVLRVTGVI
ncbi:hypothetical protein AB0M50_05270 [Nonomuraea fuscirosea]|uniref:hypothetical protein n=1 Tax=Nonomuraea fuscirosea TaxID=1291556 RepID=UPI003436879C